MVHRWWKNFSLFPMGAKGREKLSRLSRRAARTVCGMVAAVSVFLHRERQDPWFFAMAAVHAALAAIVFGFLVLYSNTVHERLAVLESELILQASTINSVDMSDGIPFGPQIEILPRTCDERFALVAGIDDAFFVSGFSTNTDYAVRGETIVKNVNTLKQHYPFHASVQWRRNRVTDVTGIARKRGSLPIAFTDVPSVKRWASDMLQLTRPMIHIFSRNEAALRKALVAYEHVWLESHTVPDEYGPALDRLRESLQAANPRETTLRFIRRLPALDSLAQFAEHKVIEYDRVRRSFERQRIPSMFVMVLVVFVAGVLLPLTAPLFPCRLCRGTIAFLSVILPLISYTWLLFWLTQLVTSITPT